MLSERAYLSLRSQRRGDYAIARQFRFRETTSARERDVRSRRHDRRTHACHFLKRKQPLKKAAEPFSVASICADPSREQQSKRKKERRRKTFFCSFCDVKFSAFLWTRSLVFFSFFSFRYCCSSFAWLSSLRRTKGGFACFLGGGGLFVFVIILWRSIIIGHLRFRERTEQRHGGGRGRGGETARGCSSR